MSKPISTNIHIGLKIGGRPIPSTILADSIRDKYSKLSAKPRKDGKPRTDSGVRTFIIRSDFEMYKNAWHILEN